MTTRKIMRYYTFYATPILVLRSIQYYRRCPNV